MTIALSVDTRVRVLRLLNMTAIVLPISELSMLFGMELDLMACLWEAALRIKAVSSLGAKSAIERKCRGAKGEVGGVAADDWRRRGALEKREGTRAKLRKA